MAFDYFYPAEPRRFKFYRVPKILMQDEQFKKLSIDAKMLYGLLLDKMTLSSKSGWMDEQNRIYVIYRISEIMQDLGCCKETAVKVLGELERAGLVEKAKRKCGQPDLLYCRNIFKDKQHNIKQAPLPIGDKSVDNVGDKSLSRSENYSCKQPKKQNMKADKEEKSTREVCETDRYIHYIYNNSYSENYTDYNDNNNIYNLSINQSFSKNLRDMMDIYSDVIKDDINYDSIKADLGFGYRRLDEIVEILVETICINTRFVRIGGEDYPHDLVKSKLLKLREPHIRYVLECMEQTTTKIANIRSYLLTALFNAPSTMDSYYRQLVQHDMYGAG